MSATAHSPAATRAAPDPLRRTALVAGLLYLLTFVSIPTLVLYGPVRDHADFVLGSGSGTGVLVGAALEVVVALAGIGTAVVLYPVLKRQSATAALGLVTARLLETSLIFVGAISLLSVVTLRDGGTAGTDPAALVATAHALTAVYTWTFLLSQSLVPVACDLLLGYLLYRSGLVPRILPIIALVGAPLLLASDVAVFFGAYANRSALAGLAALPVAVFELSLGVWLVVKGFQPAAVSALGRAEPDPPRRGATGDAVVPEQAAPEAPLVRGR